MNSRHRNSFASTSRQKVRDVAASVGIVLAVLLASGAIAQQSYPSRPIKIVVPFAAGGPSDVLARTLAQKLNATWGQAVVVENRTLSGHISLMFNNPITSLAHIKAGRLRALAVSTVKRTRELPDVPTIAESGLPIHAPAASRSILLRMPRTSWECRSTKGGRLSTSSRFSRPRRDLSTPTSGGLVMS